MGLSSHPGCSASQATGVLLCVLPVGHPPSWTLLHTRLLPKLLLGSDARPFRAQSTGPKQSRPRPASGGWERVASVCSLQGTGGDVCECPGGSHRPPVSRSFLPGSSGSRQEAAGPAGVTGAPRAGSGLGALSRWDSGFEQGNSLLSLSSSLGHDGGATDTALHAGRVGEARDVTSAKTFGR